MNNVVGCKNIKGFFDIQSRNQLFIDIFKVVKTMLLHVDFLNHLLFGLSKFLDISENYYM